VNKKGEFGRFSELTKRLLSVPKSEIDKRHKEWQEEKDRKRKPRKTTEKQEK
jgi:hypothetical protein